MNKFRYLPSACEGQTIERQFFVDENCLPSHREYIIRVVSGGVCLRAREDSQGDETVNYENTKINDILAIEEPLGLYGWEIYDSNGLQVRTMLAEQVSNLDGTRGYFPSVIEEVPFNTIDKAMADAVDYLEFLSELDNEQRHFYNRLSCWGEDDEWIWSSFDQADVVWAENTRDDYDHDFTEDIDFDDLREERKADIGRRLAKEGGYDFYDSDPDDHEYHNQRLREIERGQ